jgi:hypothetical protein
VPSIKENLRDRKEGGEVKSMCGVRDIVAASVGVVMMVSATNGINSNNKGSKEASASGSAAVKVGEHLAREILETRVVVTTTKIELWRAHTWFTVFNTNRLDVLFQHQSYGRG